MSCGCSTATTARFVGPLHREGLDPHTELSSTTTTDEPERVSRQATGSSHEFEEGAERMRPRGPFFKFVK